MTIITFGTDDRDILIKSLLEMAEELKKSQGTPLNWLGVDSSQVDNELQSVPEQPFVTMGSWLHFDSDGNKLKLTLGE